MEMENLKRKMRARTPMLDPISTYSVSPCFQMKMRMTEQRRVIRKQP
jgi:hypothetical protein